MTDSPMQIGSSFEKGFARFRRDRTKSLLEASAWNAARKSRASLVKAASTRGNSEVRVERFSPR